MAAWRQVSWRRVAIALVIVFSAMYLIGKAVEREEPWIEARRICRDTPGINLIPAAPPNTRLAQLTGDRPEFFGISIQTPWRGMGTSRLESNVVTIPFPDSHAAILLFKPESGQFERAMWDRVMLDRGSAAKSTSFGLMKAEMEVTPDALKWWRSRSRNEAASFLLELKALKLGNARAIYTVGFGELRGFQEGDPQFAPYRVRLDLYDANDLHYEILISQTKGSSPAISQAEINAMIASIQRVSSDSTQQAP